MNLLFMRKYRNCGKLLFSMECNLFRIRVHLKNLTVVIKESCLLAILKYTGLEYLCYDKHSSPHSLVRREATV